MRVGTTGIEEQVVPSAPRLASSKSAISFPYGIQLRVYG
jgi:hypothetical protein